MYATAEHLTQTDKGREALKSLEFFSSTTVRRSEDSYRP